MYSNKTFHKDTVGHQLIFTLGRVYSEPDDLMTSLFDVMNRAKFLVKGIYRGSETRTLFLSKKLRGLAQAAH